MEHESPPITTRPGLPPQTFFIFRLKLCPSTYSEHHQVHYAPDGEEVAESNLEYLQHLLDEVVQDEGAVDDATAEDEEVPAVDVLNQLNGSKSCVRFDATGCRKFEGKPRDVERLFTLVPT